MRRGLAFTSLALLLAGLELSTEALSLVVGRLHTGVVSLAEGVPFHVPGVRFAIGVGTILLGLALWLLLIWSAIHRHDVASVGGICPQCGSQTRRVKRKEWQRILSLVLGERLARRHCDVCGWSGLSVRQ